MKNQNLNNSQCFRHLSILSKITLHLGQQVFEAPPIGNSVTRCYWHISIRSPKHPLTCFSGYTNFQQDVVTRQTKDPKRLIYLREDSPKPRSPITPCADVDTDVIISWCRCNRKLMTVMEQIFLTISHLLIS